MRGWEWMVAAALLVGSTPALAQPAPLDPEGVLVEELVVSARLTGPAWWKVSDEDSTVYVMATPALATKDLTFDTSVLERCLEGAEHLIIGGQIEPHPVRLMALLMTGRKTFASKEPMSRTLPPELRQRLEARLRAMGAEPDEMDNLKPAFAGFVLANSGDDRFIQIELSGVSRKVEKIARSSKIRDRPRIRKLDGYDLPANLSALAGLPPAQQRACLEDGLRQAESGAGGLREVSQRWAVGDAAFLSQADRGFGRCLANTPRIAGEIRAGIVASTAAIADALKTPGKSVALVEFRPLLAEDGVLDRLRARGFKVETPE
ncbi:TraB/GumN family protein [Phenylobacterium deserti]|uniref:TraB/GumN family protein n=1 Tax=Phenylobacterium deserti TaxID=1914756 RepID=A0A328A9W4_9CAUL|nr:TraB/GumN family protein [Phenylobacterium deserti]RAK51452.1 TraB/GumN family protein [Phenylobacterium deserti]